MSKSILVVLLVLLVTSCVPNKNIIYLQGKPLSKENIQRINAVSYKLQVNDIINIDIKSVNQDLVSMFQKSGASSGGGGNGGNSNQNFNTGGGGYFTGYTINNHGNIRLPYLGEINVLGYTTLEVRRKLEKEFLKLFKNKEDIFITVKLPGIKFTILGEIGNPGTKVTPQNTLSIIEAISNSGEISNVGNRKKVEVIRTNLNGREKFYIDVTQIEAYDSEIFYIQNNDIINILPLKQKSLGIGTTGFQSLTTIVSVFSLLTSIIIIAKNL
jgi:polysaccharide export outer membrane protein